MSTSVCVVAGRLLTPKSGAGVVDVVENGKVVSSAPEAKSYLFSNVSCETSRLCIAAGLATATSGDGILDFVTLPANPAKGIVSDDITVIVGSGGLGGVTCPSSKLCFAVGGGIFGSVVQIAGEGASAPIEQAGAPAGLQSVACTSTTACEAGGYAEVGGQFGMYQGYLDHFNGTGQETAPALAVAGVEQFFAIARIESDYDLAVGYSTGDTLITDLVDGDHAGVPKTIAGTTGGYAQGVACPSPTECVIIGFEGSAKSTIGSTQGRIGVVITLPFAGVPGAPAVTLGVPTRSTIRVTVHPPVDDGHRTVTSYRLTVQRCKAGHSGCVIVLVTRETLTPHPAGDAATVTVAGLHASTTYLFSATAINAVGAGPASKTVKAATKT